MYDFDKIVDRRGTDSMKHDYAKEMGKPEGVSPLWISDMDFQIPPEVQEAIKKCADHAIYGYTITKEDYNHAVMDWFKKHFDFETKAKWIVLTPGVVYALAMAVRAFTNEGDAVIIQKPVYNPFESVIVENNRKLVENPLIYDGEKYHIDMEDFERKIVENNVRLFILCSPHNPVGRVWTRDELYQMGQICLKHNCLVVSDEIHCDMVFDGHTHKVFSTICDDFIDNCIVCTAPSKTFNLAGLQCSNIFISNEKHRSKFCAEISKSGYSQINTMGLVACKAAYQHGHNWLTALRKYLYGNYKTVQDFFAENMPQIKVTPLEGTYLSWLDFSALNIPHKKLDDMLLNKAGIWLSSGTTFGKEGEGFWRINIACPRETLKLALSKIPKIL